MTERIAAEDSNSWQETLRLRIAAEPSLETWRSHEETRSAEMGAIADAIGASQIGTLLEVGCGNGFGTAYLGDRATFAIASDLPMVDHKSHAIGLPRAMNLFKTVGLSVPLVGCSGEALPFADNSFDTVLLLYSLEHIPDKDAALAEVRRVTTPGGRVLNAVPCAPWSLFYPFAWYFEISRRAFRRFGPKRAAPAVDGPHDAHDATAPPEVVVRDWRSFREAYPRFPLPNPHGAYRSFGQEFVQQRLSFWIARSERAGLRVVQVAALGVVPRFLFALPGRRLHRAVRSLDTWLCGRSWASRVAQFVCLVCEPGQ